MTATAASDATRIFAFRRNLVLAASAGTGKTHSLVGVVIHALLGASELGQIAKKHHPPVDPSRIVATTFSRKAAAEIRARIAQSLESLASGEKSLYRAAIDLPEPVVRERARVALERLPTAQIGTLHGFASSIVRMYAMELGISPGFEFADEADSRARLHAAIARVLERRVEAKDVDLELLAQAAGGVDALLNQLVQALGKLEEDGRGAASIAVMEGDEAACDEKFARFLAAVRPLVEDEKLGEQARRLLDAAARVDARGEADRASETSLRLVEAARAMCEVRKPPKPNERVAPFFAFRETAFGKKKLGNADIGERLVNLWLHRREFAQRARAAKDLIASCETEVRVSARSEATLGFGDVLRHARDVLRDHPHLAAELGRKYDLLLVDEFQDTSRLQRELVQLVWDRSPATRAAGTIPDIGHLRGSGLLVVGDRKQSIYGFRGADVSVFAEFCVGLAGETARRALAIPEGEIAVPEAPLADFVPLRHNRRGDDELLAFANVLSARRFTVNQPPVLYEIAYNPETEDLAPPPERVRDPEAAPVNRTTWLRLPAKKTKRLDDARVLAERIVQMHAAKLPAIHGRPPEWRDMAVLARKNDMLEAAAHALAERGVPYVVAGRGFYTTREVRDLAAMLALLLDPSDRYALVQVLRGPWASVHDETLLGLTDEARGLARVGPAWDEGVRRAFVHPDDWTALREVRRVVEALAPELDRIGAGVALRAAVRELRLEETWIQLPRGAQRVANGRKLLAMADLAPSARILIDQLDDAAEREDAETEAATFSEDEDAVRLLTIHASKGLDFPIVFLPQLSNVARPPGGSNAFWLTLGAGASPTRIAALHVDADGRVHEPPSVEELREETMRRESAELQRLTYVAVTRASDAMVLIGAEGKEGANTTAAAMTAIAASEDAVARAHLSIEDVEPPESATAAASEAALEAPPLTEPDRPIPRWRSLPIAPTALQDFARCPRRFQLVHLLHLPEPDLPPFARVVAAPVDGSAPRLDARAEGTLAHRVLERIDAAAFGDDVARSGAEASRLLAREGLAAEHPRHPVVVDRVTRFLGGEYARRLADAGAGLVREEPFVLHVDAGGTKDQMDNGESRAVVLRGTIDLVIVWPDGAVDVLDYKSARGPDAAPYAFQLDVYAHAARSRWPNAPRLRTGIVFLGGAASEPSWREPRPARDLEQDLARLGSDLVLARWRDVFPAADLAVCDELHCGYRVACHPRSIPATISIDDSDAGASGTSASAPSESIDA